MEYIETYGIHAKFMPSVVLLTFIEMRFHQVPSGIGRNFIWLSEYAVSNKTPVLKQL